MTLWDCCGRRRSLAVLASRIKHRASNRRRSNLSQAHQKSIRAVDDLIPIVMLLTNDVFFGDRQALHKASWDVTRASRTRRDSLHHWWSGAKISRDPRSFLRHVARNTTRIQRLTVDRERIERDFSSQSMVNGYAELYRSLISSTDSASHSYS